LVKAIRVAQDLRAPQLAKHMSPEGDEAENTLADSHEQITLFYAVLHENVAF
jgi:hypothetical protein